MAAVYIDTSALAKWYLNENRSDDFETWIIDQEDACISTLTATELRCLLARRRRNGELTSALEREIFSNFELDIQHNHLRLYPVIDQHVKGAINLMEALADVSLRTLDAIHLNIATDLAVVQLATADRVMMQAALRMGLQVERFD